MKHLYAFLYTNDKSQENDSHIYFQIKKKISEENVTSFVIFIGNFIFLI